MNLLDQRVIVTGAASGFGAAIAQHLASMGARVLVADLDGTGAQAMADRIGGPTLACAVDVSNQEQVLGWHRCAGQQRWHHPQKQTGPRRE
jgi:NAD(P)-dependent dehydrogenase (short-subunit alcohol dehydrogenase family)